MASLTKLVYLLIVLSIASDFINLGGRWFNTHPNGGELSVRSSSMFLPGANGLPIAPVIIGAAARVAVKAAAKALSKSAIKAAKKKAKNQARVQGNARNKARKTQGGAGKWQLSSCLSNYRGGRNPF